MSLTTRSTYFQSTLNSLSTSSGLKWIINLKEMRHYEMLTYLRVVEVFLGENNASILIKLIFLNLFRRVGLLLSSFKLPLLFNKFRQSSIILSSNTKLVLAQFNFRRAIHCFSNLRCCDLHEFDFVAVKKVGNLNPAFLIGLDLFSEELVSD